MVSIPAPVTLNNEPSVEIEPRFSRCESNVPGEWVNWQKCWSTPYRGAANEPRILAHTSSCPCFDDPIMFSLQSPAEYEDYKFWSFFVCNGCKFRLRLKGLCEERMEIEDRRAIVPVRGAGPHESKPQLWPHLSGKNFARSKEIDGPLGVGDYWSPPPSPGSSGTNPWDDYWEDADISS